jgi:hypothetical protein
MEGETGIEVIVGTYESFLLGYKLLLDESEGEKVTTRRYLVGSVYFGPVSGVGLEIKPCIDSGSDKAFCTLLKRRVGEKSIFF